MCSVMEDFYIEKLIIGGVISMVFFVKYIEKYCGMYFNVYGLFELIVIILYWLYYCGDLIFEMILIGKFLFNI